jgi:serine/threonine-protein kinase
VEHAGEVVDKDFLFETVWPGAFVVESSLTKNICILRKMLDEAGQESVIQTVSKRGYRYVGAVVEERPHEPEAATTTSVGGGGTERRASPWRWQRFAVASVVIFITSSIYVQSHVHPTKPLTEADRLYRIGRYMWSKFDAKETEKALDHFQRAAEADPKSALAFAGIADAHTLLVILGARGSSDLSRAREAALRALQLDAQNAAAHVSLGWVRVIGEFDVKEGEREYKRALELDPESVPAHYGYSCLLAHSGRLEEARNIIRRAQRLDPVAPLIAVQAARIEYYDRRYQHAIDGLGEVLEREPTFKPAHYYMAMSLGQLGRTREAREHLRLAHPHASLLATDEAWLNAVDGDRQAAHSLIAQRSEMRLSENAKSTVLLMPAISAGDKELAVQCLERMWEARRLELLLIKVSPRFDALRSDPRFEAIVGRVWPGG